MSLYCVRLSTILLHVFSSLSLSPPVPHPLRTSPLPSLMPPPLSTSPPLGQSCPDPTNSKKTSILYSNQITQRGTGSVALQYIERPDSASFLMYTPIYSKSASSIAAAIGGYYPPLPPPSQCLLGCLQLIRRATLCWKLPRDRSTQGVRTHVSYPKRNTTWMTAFKKNSISSGLPPHGPRSSSSASRSSETFSGCLPLPASCRPPPLEPVPDT